MLDGTVDSLYKELHGLCVLSWNDEIGYEKK